MVTMSREELVEWFSSNEEIDSYHVGDDTIELCGFIDCLEGTQMVGVAFASQPTPLFKMYVSNGKGRKVKVVMWNKNATKWSPLLSEKAIIRIRRAKACVYNEKFRTLRDDTNCKVELSVQVNTTIDCNYGSFDEELTDETSSSITDVLLCDVSSSTGKIRVEGWIKVPFEIITCYGGSRGSGVIVDHHHRMRVHVSVFHARPELQPGTRVAVTCQYNPENGSVLECKKSNDIVVLEGQSAIAAGELRKMGLITPKRIAEEELKSPSTKKSA
ncbi:uncharacterized protein LOC141535066 [Cotesia typhae]|uniref:uncharacterized protein LOC141535066 n=1 Tax=Cotesia typhae TaxID=2053667 RepID=UPI003D6896AA